MPASRTPCRSNQGRDAVVVGQAIRQSHICLQDPPVPFYSFSKQDENPPPLTTLWEEEQDNDLMVEAATEEAKARTLPNVQRTVKVS